MAYQALYRQWRPKDFSHMVAQEAVVETLRNQITTGRIAHAYLFCGSRGTGKTSTAKIMARAVNCEHPVNGDPCGECESCKRLLLDESLDIIEIDAASNNGVDEMRDLRESVKYPPQYGRFKVYIIDEVHMLSTSAFNALLKTLEEPPAHIVFILATTEPQKLPATILSRCQRFDFGRIPAEQIRGRLQEAVDGAGAQATPEALMMIARAAEGGMRDALSILDMCLGYGRFVDEQLVRNVLGTSDKAFLFRFTDALIGQDPATVLNMINEVMRTGREASVFAKDVSQHVRSLLTAKCCPDAMEQLLELTPEDAGEYNRQAATTTVSRLMEILDLYMHLEVDTKYTSTPRVALETVSLRACIRTTETDQQALTDRINELEKKLTELNEKLANGLPVQTATARTSRTQSTEKVKEIPSTPVQKVLTPTGRGTEDTWKETIEILKRTQPSIWPMLKNFGQLIDSDGKTYRWAPNPGSEKLTVVLATEEKKRIISSALTEASGVESVFVIATDAMNQNKKNDDSDESYVGLLKATFGAQPVEVRD